MILSKIVDAVYENVTIYDIMKLYGVYYHGDGQSESQIKCLFHGADNKPSARVYPDTNKFWCFYCQESLDIISFVIKIEDISYKRAVLFIAERFNVKVHYEIEEEQTPEIVTPIKKQQVTPEGLKLILDKIEQFLIENKFNPKIDFDKLLKYYSLWDEINKQIYCSEDLDSLKSIVYSFLSKIQKIFEVDDDNKF